MLFILFSVTTILVFANYLLGKNDYLYPPFIFCLVFFFSEFACILGIKSFDVSISPITLFVVLAGELIFTIIGAFTSHSIHSDKSNESFKINHIEIKWGYILIIIIMQLLSIVFFTKYLTAIGIAYGSRYGPVPTTLSQKIKVFDNMTKFWPEINDALTSIVQMPMIYRITNPLCNSAEYLIVYTMVNNYIYDKHINKSYIVIVILMIIRIILNGSRSPIFRLVTFILAVYYILQYKCGRIKKGSIKFLFRVIFGTLILGAIMILLMFILGRTSDKVNVADQLFIYLGAPLQNLDTVINESNFKLIGSNVKEVFGLQTFLTIEKYIVKIFHLPDLRYNNLLVFVYSHNGIEIGNVYTMYYPLLYDFGYIGCIPFIIIIASYYAINYRKLILRKQKNSVVNMKLFIYAYLFNDLIMLMFSNRFYDTTFNIVFIELVAFAYIFSSQLLRINIKID